jgi:hypothetical protein
MKIQSSVGFYRGKALRSVSYPDLRTNFQNKVYMELKKIDLDLTNSMVRLHFEGRNGAMWSNLISQNLFKQRI